MKWVSVKDNLPAPGEEVLFYDRTHENVEIGSLVTRRDAWHPSWADTLVNSKHVTHWMPLPHAPKEVECALEFSPESPDCTPCMHYGECVTEAYSESVERLEV